MAGFMELRGGRIISMATGDEVVRVCVDKLTTADAAQVVKAVMDALEEEFPQIGVDTPR